MMNRAQFMEALQRLLFDIPEAERQEALNYYESYFDDAGVENEAKVIQELGSPGKVAAMIKADLKDNNDSYAEYTEKGYEDTRDRSEQELPVERRRRRFQERGSGTFVLLLIFLVFISPFLKGAAGGLLGFIAVLIFLPFVITLGIGAAGIGLIVGAVMVGIAGVSLLVVNLPAFILMIGIACAMLAVGIALLVLAIWSAGRTIPRYIRWVTDKINNLLHRGRKVNY